ncbi:hypothetical protein Tco_1344934 [Tanacetum coccineum]
MSSLSPPTAGHHPSPVTTAAGHHQPPPEKFSGEFSGEHQKASIYPIPNTTRRHAPPLRPYPRITATTTTTHKGALVCLAQPTPQGCVRFDRKLKKGASVLWLNNTRVLFRWLSNKGACGFVISTKEGALGLKPPQQGALGSGHSRRVRTGRASGLAVINSRGGCRDLAAKQPGIAGLCGFGLGLAAGGVWVGFDKHLEGAFGLGFKMKRGAAGLVLHR